MRRRSKIGFSSRMFLSSIIIWPEVGSIKRLTMRKRVVFPEPEVPTSIQVVPSVTSKVTASTAGLLEPGNCLVMAWKAIFAIPLVLLFQENIRGVVLIICGIHNNYKFANHDS